MLNVYGFVNQVLDRKGMRFSAIKVHEVPGYKGTSVVYAGLLVRADGKELKDNDLYELVSYAHRYGIMPIIDRVQMVLNQSGEPPYEIDTYFVDLEYFMELLNQMRAFAKKWQDHNDYLQERVELLNLLSQYKKSIKNFHNIVYMSQKEDTVVFSYDEMVLSIEAHNEIISAFFIRYHMTEDAETVHSDLVEEMEKRFLLIKDTLFIKE